MWRLKKFCLVEPLKNSSIGFQSVKVERKRQKKQKNGQCKERRCIDYWFWVIGYMCTTWWFLSLLYGCLSATLLGFEAPVSPGVRLSREGVTALHPVVLVPGIVTDGLELWEGRSCAEGLFRKRLWGDGLAQILKRPLCWLEHLSLHDETGLDPPGIKVRAVPGVVAADNFASGYLVWADLIENLARIGYEGKNLYMAAYDWRLSFQNTEIRDQSLSTLKSNVELMFETNGYKKVVVVPQSIGAIYFLHFLKWVEAPPPMGGGGGPGWCDKYIKSILNISPAFLGVPRAFSNILSTEGSFGFVRAVAFGITNFDYLGRHTLELIMKVFRTWDSTVSLMPKGGKTIWGDLNWCPEEWNNYDQEISRGGNSATFNLSRKAVWTDNDDISRKSIPEVTKNRAYIARTAFDLPNFVAPTMMKRGEAHFSYGIAENLEDPKYAHYKYWSNSLETKLPNAPDMEIYCLYGVGIPHEKLVPSDKSKSIPFQFDGPEDGKEESWSQNGVYSVDGDESVSIVSSGFMCVKGWRGRTRFNPSGLATYAREYLVKQRGSLIDRSRVLSGKSSNIVGNVALIEDVLLVAGGATGVDIGGDRIFSDIMRMSERINLRL
ncbi:putative phospholipid:diacylglycerol acyltransferase 2 [Phaseolus vulgaris]|uniref:putative phospholipid:diacylglycerol acyltransferase 2 n=1 Tax=Phaseolus vulgaris TaxID=3885 RepID=UPI0035C99198